MEIKDILNTLTINLESKSLTKEAVLLEAGNLLLEDNRITATNPFLEAVYEREKVESTNLDMRVAIPHLHSRAVNKTSIVIIKLDKEIDWEDGGELVKTIFLFAVSKNDPGTTHVKLLSKVAVLLMDDDFKAFLEETKDKEKLLNRIYDEIGGLK